MCERGARGRGASELTCIIKRFLHKHTNSCEAVLCECVWTEATDLFEVLFLTLAHNVISILYLCSTCLTAWRRAFQVFKVSNSHTYNLKSGCTEDRDRCPCLVITAILTCYCVPQFPLSKIDTEPNTCLSDNGPTNWKQLFQETGQFLFRGTYTVLR
jgi:hypothetical protein